MHAHSHWSFEPWTAALLAVTAVLYAAGCVRLRRGAASGQRALPAWSAAAFAAGWLSVGAALLSPIASLSEVLFSFHMTQHELLMLVAAPLLVLGRPLAVALWAFPPGGRAAVGAWVRRPAVRRTWSALTGALSVWLLHGLAIWIWHLPVLYEAALRSPAVHGWEHACFLVTACLFWWALVHGRYGRLGYGVAVLYVFATAIHTGALGALLTFAPRVLYPLYASRGRALGLDPLADQQLAGLVMWIPFGVVFLVIGLALFSAWLGESERRGRAVSPPPAAPGGAAVLAVALALALGASGCERSGTADAERWTGGNVDRGAARIQHYGCGACHRIPGIPGANARVGPSLEGIARQSYVAGRLPNEPRELVAWIRDPQHLRGETAMPNLGISEPEARDIAAYLYTLR